MQAGSLLVVVLCFVAVGLALRQLLLFYPERPEARRAAAKFSLVWGAGDVALILASALLAFSLGTGSLADTQHGRRQRPARRGTAWRGAARPRRGTQDRGLPAPRLAHRGDGGAHPRLRAAPCRHHQLRRRAAHLRCSGLVQASPGAMAALVMMGGLTALFGASVMLTQSAVKTALAWSTIAQMGFMLLQCGLGLWTLALLHIVAHSLYKAHAFLSSGGAVRQVALVRRPGPVAVPGFAAVAKAFLLALLLFAAVAGVFGWVAAPKSPQSLALGVILIFGVAYLVAQGLADAAPRALTLRTAAASLAAAVAYFSFQLIAGAVWGASLPEPPAAGALEWALIVLALASFGVVAVAQALFPLWAHHPAAAGLRVHLANGLYLNTVLDRLTGGFRLSRTL